MPGGRRDEDTENSLLGDLESIRTLLAGHGAEAPKSELRDGAADASDVPMLDDVVEGALRVDEAPLASKGSFESDVDGPSALADDAIEALMGDEWRESAEQIVRAARQAMAASAVRWTDEETRSLHDSLRQRIDGALNDWMAEITLNHIDELRQRLLDAIEDEVLHITDRLSRAPHGE